MATGKITIINNTSDPEYYKLRIAVYQTDELRPNQDRALWAVVDPAPLQGRAIISVPETYQVYVAYEDDLILYESNTILLNSFSALIQAVATKNDASGETTISLKKISEGINAPVQGHVQVDIPPGLNHSLQVHILKGYRELLPALLVPPGETADFKVGDTFYLARIDQATPPHSLLSATTLSTSMVPIQSGGTAIVTGNERSGFTITVNY